MKKVLFATTALIATAGMAAADVSMNGYARWGLKHVEDNSNGDDTYLTSRYRINLDTSTETDAGVRLAARIRIQADDDKGGSAKVGGFNGARFQIGYEGLRVRAGNISGVFDDATVLDYYGNEPGLTGLTGQYSTFGGPVIGYSSGGAGVNGVNALYEMNGFSVMAAFTANNQDATLGDQWELGVGYEFGDWQVGVAFGSQEQAAGSDIDYWAAVASGSVGPADVSVFIGDDDASGDTSYGISAAFDAGASTQVIASIAAGGKAEAVGKDEVYGIGFKHGLGGGASLRGGIGQNIDGKTVADFGVRFDF